METTTTSEASKKSRGSGGNGRLLHRRSKTFHTLPRKTRFGALEGVQDSDSSAQKRSVRPKSCLNITSPKYRPLTASILQPSTDKTECRSKNVTFFRGNGYQQQNKIQEKGDVPSSPVYRGSLRRSSSASQTKSPRSSTTSSEPRRPRLLRRSNSPSFSLTRGPGLIRLSGSLNLRDFEEVDDEHDEEERRRKLREKFRHAVRLVRIFTIFCMGIRRYAEQEQSTEYDLYYLRDMLPDNEDKPTPVQEASLYFNKSLFSRDNTLHFPFWARWTCALNPSDRTDAEISKLVTLLRGMKSFQKFSREAQWHLCSTMNYARYEKRRIIIRQGHPGFCFYFIVSGTVSVTVTRCDLKTGIHVTSTVDVLEKNDAFGEIALMNEDARRTATIICRERVEVLVVNRDTVMENCPDVFHKEFEEKFIALRAHDIFKRWDDKPLKSLCYESHIKELAHGKLVDPDSTTSDAIYFILKGKVDMLRRLELCDVLSSKASINPSDTRPLPRPSSAMPGHGKPKIEFMNVGSLYKNDTWDIRSVFKEGFNEPGNILVSAGVRLLKVPKHRVIQLSPMGALDEFGKKFVQNHRCPTDEELYKEYMTAQSWIEYRQKVVKNVLDSKRGYHVTHTSSISKGTSGWGPWPGKAIKHSQVPGTQDLLGPTTT